MARKAKRPEDGERQSSSRLSGIGEKEIIWEGKDKRKSRADKQGEQEMDKSKQLLATV